MISEMKCKKRIAFRLTTGIKEKKTIQYNKNFNNLKFIRL